ncbi:hypothetical protein SO802_018966 [Lithocarpus litseifolius]|uniref:Uncharacterized protein n=1 Tax=Lithocarpus litseifolius TaxID=425828 RepID=A0AAW2CPG5_9ROSI
MELTGRRMTWICSYVLLQILFISSYATSRSIVKTLPGFDGDLPFKLETGYVGVGEMDDVQLFYYFVESQREPSRDPLLVWLTGGPGCSSFKPFFCGNGDCLPYLYARAGCAKAMPVQLGRHHVGWTKSAKTSCKSDYVNIDPTNERCMVDVEAIDELLRGINTLQVLEPVYAKGSLKADKVDWDQRILMSTPNHFLHSLPRTSAFWCRDYEFLLAEIWANIPSVREALHVREGSKGYWHMCNSSLAYTKNILSTIDYHRNLSRTNLRALIYCADLDMSIPHIATQEMIRSLNLTLDDSWRAWFVDAQVAGLRYKNNDFYMTYSSVKGAGHVAEEYKPKEVNAMIDRWLAYYPL